VQDIAELTNFAIGGKDDATAVHENIEKA
jgi:hypothetical protein